MRPMRRIEGAAEQPMRMPRACGGKGWRLSGWLPAAGTQERTHSSSLPERLPSPRIARRKCRNDWRIRRNIMAAFSLPRMRYLKLVNLRPDRSARMQPAGGDADLGAEAELAAIGKLGRSIVEHDRRIGFAEEFLRRFFVFGDDRVRGDASRDALHGDHAVDAVYDAGGQDRIEIFGARIGFACRFHAAIDGLNGGIAADLAAGISSMVIRGLRTWGAGAIDQQRLGRAADAGAAILAFSTISLAMPSLALPSTSTWQTPSRWANTGPASVCTRPTRFLPPRGTITSIAPSRPASVMRPPRGPVSARA